MKPPRPPNSPQDTKRFKSWINNFAAYRHSVTKASIEDWLNQFSDAVSDQDTAARVLDAVEFYGQDRIAAAFKKSLTAVGWPGIQPNHPGRWRFVAYSRSSGESGDTMLHQFRLANRLDGKQYNHLFIHPSQLVLQKLTPQDTVVLLDDFVGTGKQVCDSWEESFSELVAGAGNVYLFVVVATRRGMEKVKDETELSLVPSHVLGDADDIFSDACKHFSPREKQRLLQYNCLAKKQEPRGFGDCGVLVVFQHRCPNDAIPILHATNSNWTALFPRHD